MSLTLAVIVFFLAALALAALPFVPAVVEWRTRSDAEPLRVVRDFQVNIRHFAWGFLSFLESKLGSVIAACEQTGQAQEGAMENGVGYLVVPSGHRTLLNRSEEESGTTERIFISCGELALPREMMFMSEIYARGWLKAGENCVFRAVLAQGDLELGEGSVALRWLHSEKKITVGPNSILYGRVSADESMELGEGCSFERIHAPSIGFAVPPERAGRPRRESVDRDLRRIEHQEIDRMIEDEAGRWLVARELVIPPDVLVEADLVVMGWCRIGRGSRIVGSIKSQKDLYVEEGVEIEGSLVSGHRLYLSPGCKVLGPVLAEGDIYIDRDNEIGETNRLTTVSGDNIYVGPGTKAHGTVWAHGRGLMGRKAEKA